MEMVRVPPRYIAGTGLLVALGAGLWGMVVGDGFLAGQWVEVNWGFISGLKLGTPLLFDAGVALVVLGAVIAMLISLLEDE